MLTKLKLALMISAPLVAGAATYAIAGGGGAHKAEMLQKFDKNGDGKLDDAERAEMKTAFAAKRAEHKKEMLATFDANKDGQLDDTERAAMRDAKLTERFKAMDANADGKLSIDEFKAGAPRGFGHHGRRGHGKHHGAPLTQGVK
jgi:hypothetical protein